MIRHTTAPPVTSGPTGPTGPTGAAPTRARALAATLGPTGAAPTRPRPLAATLVALVALAGHAGACAPGDRPGDGNAEVPEAAASPAAEADGVVVEGPWVRVAIVPEPAEGDAPPVNSAAYLVLRNGTAEDDALLAVETPVADTAEIHSVSMDGDVMRMRAVPEVPVPAGGEAVLRPGGYHVMLIGLRGPLSEGDTVPLTLRLRSGRTLRLAAPVRRGPR